MNALTTLGWDGGWAQALADHEDRALVPARVTAVHRGRYAVRGDDIDALVPVAGALEARRPRPRRPARDGRLGRAARRRRRSATCCRGARCSRAPTTTRARRRWPPTSTCAWSPPRSTWTSTCAGSSASSRSRAPAGRGPDRLHEGRPRARPGRRGGRASPRTPAAPRRSCSPPATAGASTRLRARLAPGRTPRSSACPASARARSSTSCSARSASARSRSARATRAAGTRRRTASCSRSRTARC